MSNKEDLILELLQTVKKEVTDQGKAIARLEISDDHRIDMLEEIKVTIKEIQNTDLSQTKSIQEAIGRIERLDEKTSRLEEELDEHLLSHIKNTDAAQSIVSILKDSSESTSKTRQYYLDVLSKVLPYIFGASGIITILLESFGIINIMK